MSEEMQRPAPGTSKDDMRMFQGVEPRGKLACDSNSDGSTETPLGSLDKTNVPHGDSVKTTGSMKCIRDNWGTEGTMAKIVNLINMSQPVTVARLIKEGPVVPGYTKMAAAMCFASILKLKQDGFINITKDPVTLEIKDITLGPKR